MDKVKIGVIGGGRGKSMIRYGREASNAQLVAICDFRDDVLDRMKKECGEDGISYYSDYDEFLKHDMDAVVLANYANEHAPFAIRAMKKGFHVFSEVLPVLASGISPSNQHKSAYKVLPSVSLSTFHA